MKHNFFKNFYTFDFYKGLVLTFFIGTVLYLAISLGRFNEGLVFIFGVLFAFFANVEGTTKHRTLGMVAAVGVALFNTLICLLTADFTPVFYILTWLVLLFSTSLLAAYGYRGSMLAFSGLFAVVMSFSYQRLALPNSYILELLALGGVAYIGVSLLVHRIIKNRTIEFLLADTIELTATYLQVQEKLNWEESTDTLKLQNTLLKTQSAINEKHEALRVVLLHNVEKITASGKTKRYYLLFLELITVYEMAIGNYIQVDEWKTELGEHFEKTQAFRKVSKAMIDELNLLAEAIRFRKAYGLPVAISDLLRAAEHVITEYVAAVKPPKAREGALLMRNLHDYEVRQWQRLQLIDKIYNQLVANENPSFKKQTSTLFITDEVYSLNVLRANFSLDSAIFRHGLRLTLAVLLAFFVGKVLQQPFANWIIVTVIVILRPNYGLTKNRLKNRIIGTIIGAIFAVSVLLITQNTWIYGSLAILATLIGFTYIQKNYRIAAACITIGILFLYAVIMENPLEIIQIRLLDTLLGAAISFMAIFMIFPSWEVHTIQESIIQAIDANKAYLESVNELYHTKEEASVTYKLIRKEAFLANGNLNAAFLRMTEEPKSKRQQIHRTYAMVLLNHTFLSATAALSAYIQTHTTTSASEHFELIIRYIVGKLDNAIEILQEMALSPLPSREQVTKAQEVLYDKYDLLNRLRDKEWEQTHTPMSEGLRAKFQEGKLIINQLNWLVELAEQSAEMSKVIREKN